MQEHIEQTARSRPWLEALKRLHDGTPPDDPPENHSAKSLIQGTDKTAKSPLADDDPEVQWRIAALRPHVARLGPLDPIRMPPARANVPPLVSQDPATGDYRYNSTCASCGEPREPGQTYHCRACTRARQIVLEELREDAVSPAPADGEKEGAA